MASHTTPGVMTICHENIFRGQSHYSWRDDDMPWKHFPHYCPSVRGIYRSWWALFTEDQQCMTLMFSRANFYLYSRLDGDLRRHDAHVTSLEWNSVWTRIFFIIIERGNFVGKKCNFYIIPEGLANIIATYLGIKQMILIALRICKWLSLTANLNTNSWGIVWKLAWRYVAKLLFCDE